MHFLAQIVSSVPLDSLLSAGCQAWMILKLFRVEKDVAVIASHCRQCKKTDSQEKKEE